MKIGILIQGSITEWTPHIINEYKENFPEAEILLSTWNNENIGDINCDLIQLEKPEKTTSDEDSSTRFKNVEYQGYNLDNPFVLKSEDAFILDENDIKRYEDIYERQ